MPMDYSALKKDFDAIIKVEAQMSNSANLFDNDSNASNSCFEHGIAGDNVRGICSVWLLEPNKCTCESESKEGAYILAFAEYCRADLGDKLEEMADIFHEQSDISYDIYLKLRNNIDY